MAKIYYAGEIDTISGELHRGSGITHRRKHYNAYGENITGENEVFKREKRDYRRKPLRPGEAATVQRFREAGTRVKAILADPTSETYRSWEKRFRAQLRKPEPTSPKDSKGHPKKYCRLDNCIRAKLMEELRTAV